MIKIKHVSKQFASRKAVNDISLTIEEGETLALLGSSGSGKTTLLKMINRLIEPSSGHIEVDGQDTKAYKVNDLRRMMGYVFQQVGLFPHMTIEENITVVLKLMGKSSLKRKKRAHELLNLINLNPTQYAQRYPDELSGGEQQRVGVARALVADPRYLLMDEPFGALDAIRRDALQEEMIRLKSKLNKTIVFVTHDLIEAFRIADRIAVIHQGKLQQIDNKEKLIRNPANQFVSDLINKPIKQLKELTSEG